MKIEGLIRAHWELKYGYPVIKLYTRAADGEKKIITVNNFRPYFYVPKEEADKRCVYVVDIEPTQKRTLLGNREVTKVYVRTPSDVYEARKFFSQTYEADVMFTSRFLIDHVDEMVKTKLHVVLFDIETTSDSGFPDKNNPIESIISITVHSNYKQKYYTLLLDPKGERDELILGEKWNIRWFKDEKIMLQYFFQLLKEVDFDIIGAWNSSFDIGYTFARAEKLGILPSLYLDGAKIDEYGELFIVGRNSIDLLEAFKRIRLSELPSYSLDYVAKEILGENEGKTRILNIGEKWREDPMFIAEYNKKDTELLVRINDKVRIIDYWLEIQYIGFLPSIEQCFAFSLVLDNIILKLFKDKYVFPNKTKRDKVPIGGGYVKEPTRGIYDWVYVYDFSAMYPTIIKTFNLSKDTIVEDGDSDYTINGTKWLSEKTRKGILPQILDVLISWRNNFKKEMKKYPVGSHEYDLYWMKQFAAKFLVNSCYGVNAYPSFRLYDTRVADTITYLGREINQYLGKRLEEETPYKVIAADTDSLFVYGINKYSLDEGIAISKKLNKYTADYVHAVTNGKATNVMEIGLEKIFDRVLLCEKKRYIGRLYWNEGTLLEPEKRKLKYVGVDIKRNNISPLIKRGLEDFVVALFNEGEQAAENVVSAYIKAILDSKNIEDFMIPTKIEKDYSVNVPQKRAALFANRKWKLGFGPGSKFYSVWITGKETDIIGFDIADRAKEYVSCIDKVKYAQMFVEKVQLLYDIRRDFSAEINGYSRLDQFLE